MGGKERGKIGRFKLGSITQDCSYQAEDRDGGNRWAAG